MSHESFETFEHGADAGIRGYGPSLEEAFRQTARAMFSLMADNLDLIRPEQKIQVKASATDSQYLLVAWLNALLTEADLHKMLFCDFEVSIQELEVKSGAWGQVIDPETELGVEVKGATFSQLAVYQNGDLWVAQCVVDV